MSINWMKRALDLAAQAIEAGELPIAAVIVLNDRSIAEAWTTERATGHYLVHAELLALQEMDRQALSRTERRQCVLYTTLEPCMMCLGAAITAQIGEVFYALESPGDGAHKLLGAMDQLPPLFTPPPMHGGMCREESRGLFADYTAAAKPGGLRDWAERLSLL